MSSTKSQGPPAKRLRKSPLFSETPRSKLGKQNVKLYSAFNQQVGQSSEAILNLTVPHKIMHLHRLVAEIPSQFEQVVPLNPTKEEVEAWEAAAAASEQGQPQPQPPEAAGDETKAGSAKGKRAGSKVPAVPAVGDASDASSSSDEDSDDHEDSMPSSVSKPRRGCIVPQNPSVHKLITLVKQEVRDLIHFVSILKLNIQLRVPQVEDGGSQFGVGVQEEAVGELSHVEDAGYSYLELIPSYHASRATLSSAILRFPGVLDYRLAIAAFDEQFFLKFQLCITELRNQYLRVFDLLTKNQEKIKDPQGANHSSFMR